MKLYDLLMLISLDSSIIITDWTGKEHITVFNGNMENLEFVRVEDYKNYRVICINTYNNKIIIDVIGSN